MTFLFNLTSASLKRIQSILIIIFFFMIYTCASSTFLELNPTARTRKCVQIDISFRHCLNLKLAE